MQGFNMGRYVPPEHEGTLTGNQLHRKKPPGSTLTVRFEMPFNIVCTHCNNHIAQGVRFNAEKCKVGTYFSTPVWGFKMKHSVCAGVIEIRTDPKNTAYVVVEGARKQYEGGEAEGGGVIRVRPLLGEEDDGGVMGKLEKDKVEEGLKKEHESRIEELRKLSERQWADPYEHSRKMRRIFRTERNRLSREAAQAANLQDRFSLGIALLPETEEDVLLASTIEFGGEGEDGGIGVEGRGKSLREVVGGRPMFSGSGGEGNRSGEDSGKGESEEGNRGGKRRDREDKGKGKGKRKLTKAEMLAAETKRKLERKLRSNTRSRIDPFWADVEGGGSGGSGVTTPPKVLVGLKRRKVENTGSVSGGGGGDLSGPDPGPEPVGKTIEGEKYREQIPPRASVITSTTSPSQIQPKPQQSSPALVSYTSSDDDDLRIDPYYSGDDEED